jgi:CheY-like chemotaxis protein
VHDARRILLVDDDSDIRTVARLSLTRIGGLHVTEAGSGGEALSLVFRHRFDGVLLDISMPDMDGRTVLQALRVRQQTAPMAILFFTAHVLPDERKHLESFGVNGVIEKPFDPLSLPDLVISRLPDSAPSTGRVVRSWDEVVQPKLETLWDNHRAAMLLDVTSVEVFVESWGTRQSPAPSAVRAATEAVHRLCGAFGVYGRDRASTIASHLHALIVSDDVSEQAMERAFRMIRDLRREVAEP